MGRHDVIEAVSRGWGLHVAKEYVKLKVYEDLSLIHVTLVHCVFPRSPIYAQGHILISYRQAAIQTT
jgi:hypothetical protein